MRTLCVLVVVAAACSPAFADAGKVVVTAIDTGKVESGRAGRVEQAIKDALTKNLGERVVFVAEKASCARDPACVKGLLEQHGADELASFALDADGRALAVTLEVKDAQGKVATRGRQKISSSGVEEDLSRLIVRTLSPSRYTGRLVIDGTPPGGQVIVDDLPIRALDAKDRTTLSVGPHRVMFVPPGQGGKTTTKEVDVPYGGQVVLTFPAPEEPAAAVADPQVVAQPAVAVPLWPAYITGALAAGGLAVTVTVITVELVTQPISDDNIERLTFAMSGENSLANVDDPTQTKWEGYGGSADKHAAMAAVAAAGLAEFDLATALSWATIGGGTAIAIAGGIATGALVAASLSGPSVPAGDVE